MFVRLLALHRALDQALHFDCLPRFLIRFAGAHPRQRSQARRAYRRYFLTDSEIQRTLSGLPARLQIVSLLSDGTALAATLSSA